VGGALFDERTGLSFVRVTVSSNKSVVTMYNLHFTCYLMYVKVKVKFSPLQALEALRVVRG
jgi:hypothetical protein